MDITMDGELMIMFKAQMMMIDGETKMKMIIDYYNESDDYLKKE